MRNISISPAPHQVSGSKIWQTERSCMCCQESGEREATVTLACPKARMGEPRVRKVSWLSKRSFGDILKN